MWRLVLIHRFQSFSLIVIRIDQFVSLPLENAAATGLAGTYVKIGKVPRQGRIGGDDHNPRQCVFRVPRSLRSCCASRTLVALIHQTTPRLKCTIQGVRLFKNLATTLHLLL